MTADSEALPTGFEALRAGFEALSAGSGPISGSSEALPAGVEALTLSFIMVNNFYRVAAQLTLIKIGGQREPLTM